MTSEDLTLTVLAPASFTSPPSVVPLISSSSSSLSPFSASGELVDGAMSDKRGTNQGQKVEGGPLSVSVNEQTVPRSDVATYSDLGCTHLWLQSRVPLGYILSHFPFFFKL